MGEYGWVGRRVGVVRSAWIDGYGQVGAQGGHGWLGAAKSMRNKSPQPTGRVDNSAPHQLLASLNCQEPSTEPGTILSYSSAATSEGKKSVKPPGARPGP